MGTTTYTTGDLAARLGGDLEGDPAIEIRDVKPLGEAGAGEISFLSNNKYLKEFGATRAACVVIPRKLEGAAPRPGLTVIRHDAPYVAFAKLIELLRPAPPRPAPGIDAGARIAPTAKVGEGASVGFGAVVEDGAEVGERAIVGPLCYVGHRAKIGAGTRLHPRAVVYHEVEIGRNCTLHSGCVVGADGFGYATEGGWHHKIPQVGNVVIEDDVEIGANTTIDRAVLGSTRIGMGAKIDNLVMIAHNCEVGPGSIIVAQAGISGSTKLGAYVVVAAQAGIVGHIEIGDMAQIGAQSGVTKNVGPGAKVLGSPASDARDAVRALAIMDRLPEMKRAIADHEKRLGRLEGGGADARGVEGRG